MSGSLPSRPVFEGRWLSVVRLSLALMLSVSFVACADDAAAPPDLLPIEAQQVLVNDTLRIDLVVENPRGLALNYSFTGPELPGLDGVTELAGTPFGGEFRLTPLASHVGTHEFVFTVASTDGADSETVLITVAPPESAAPIFLRPGAGATFDLERDPCVSFDVEVRDDDSSDVEIRFRSTGPFGSSLDATGPKQAAFEWCPTPEQTNQSERWNVELEADDRDHRPTEHDYLIVLRVPTREDCDGLAPEISVQSPAPGGRVESAISYPIEAQFSDDRGIRDDPLLYYTTVAPEDLNDPDVTSFDQITFKFLDDVWRAEISSIELDPGEERVVYYVVSVTDNDDENGTACDHRTETDLRQFTAARGEAPVEQVADCEPCAESTGCQSGVCAQTDGVGRCLPVCGAAGACDLGECLEVITTEGTSGLACGSVGVVCDGEDPPDGGCQDDTYEPNDNPEAPADFDADLSAEICPGDDDIYAISVAAGTQFTLMLDQFQDADLDLALYTDNLTYDIIGYSNTTNSVESVSHCTAETLDLLAHVYGYQADDSSVYRLTLDETSSDCCVNDDYEPNNTSETARSTLEDNSFDGFICPGDVDYVYFETDGPTRVSATIIFENSEVDLDLELYSSDGTRVGNSAGLEDIETIEVDLPSAGRYTLRVFAYDDGSGPGSGEYLGEVALETLSSCGTTDDCPIGTVCDTGTCQPDGCGNDDDCPSGHFCAVGGPLPAASHCVAECGVNADCRDEGPLEEACKRFVQGRGCAQLGSGANGDACFDFSDCGGQRACVDWPGGYCAREACTSNSDCESNTVCADVGVGPVCVRLCGDGQPECRLAEGYFCDVVIDVLETDVFEACIPFF